ncbi:potassium transporter [Lipomyces orientalis]|uniref:Potassium transporter n=1 Tax=Lipomyces orientalis TaxID=1233043 RepID=A0ACC3TH40_9ASCO
MEKTKISIAPTENNPIRLATTNLSAPSSLAFEPATKHGEDRHADEDGSVAIEDVDVKHRQEFSGLTLAFLAYQSIGVIYGDIGTSPLYVYSSTFLSSPSYDDLVGALSLIIWSLTLIVTVKYVLIVLRADDEGEGGTFALYSLLSRYSNIATRDPKTISTVKMKRYLTADMKYSNRKARSTLEKSRFAQHLLKMLAVLGVSLIMADGVLTPAQSVLGAIQGLEIVKPDIGKSVIIGVSCAILILLFAVQPFGTSRLAIGFAPIVIIWLAFNAAFGIYNLALFDHSVLKAFSPYFAGHYLVRNGEAGWKSLGGVLLAFTGVEALFADLGAFSRRAIQLSWLCYTYPCLLLAYIGQAAFISRDPSAYSNPFFNSVLPGMFYPSLVISILAAIVASQAMITSTFQLLTQIMKLSYFPNIKVVHTSSKFYGQIYIPIANWVLMVGTVVVTAAYNNTTRLGNAYGVCVILVTFITTCMVSLVALIIWRLNPFLVALFFLTYALLEGTFLTSNLTKVPDGAWLTLAIAAILSSTFMLWRYGKDRQWKSESAHQIDLTQIVAKSSDGKERLAPAFGGGELVGMKGVGIFFDKGGDKVPTVYAEFLQKFEMQQEYVIFFHLRPLPLPTVAEAERYNIRRTKIPNTFRIMVRHGYNDRIISSDLATLLFNSLRTFIIQEHAAKPRLTSVDGDHTVVPPSNVDAVVAGEIQALTKVFDEQVVFIVGKEQLKITAEANYFKRFILSVFLWIRENTRNKIAELDIPVDELVEIGFVREI